MAKVILAPSDAVDVFHVIRHQQLLICKKQLLCLTLLLYPLYQPHICEYTHTHTYTNIHTLKHTHTFTRVCLFLAKWCEKSSPKYCLQPLIEVLCSIHLTETFLYRHGIIYCTLKNFVRNICSYSFLNYSVEILC